MTQCNPDVMTSQCETCARYCTQQECEQEQKRREVIDAGVLPWRHGECPMHIELEVA